MTAVTPDQPTRINRLLVANRGEIAIRIFRAAAELGIETLAVFADEDKLSLHRFKADEAYQIGRGADGTLRLGPLEAYLSIEEVIRIARMTKADAIHPGYGFLAESPELAEACAANGIVFVGPSPQTMRALGNKVSARELAVSVNVPVIPATGRLPADAPAIEQLARQIGYPLMVKASWGGGGRGMRSVESENELIDAVRAARREALAAFGKDEVYLEKLVRHARHVEVQILGDMHGNRLHLFERDCSVQRRNQKIIERAPDPYLDQTIRAALCEAALKLADATDYVGAGTVEFLMDVDTNSTYFIEVNPRIQVEHTVTEQVTGLDIVKAQIRIMEGGRLGLVDETGIPPQSEIRLNGHALQCRITTESPNNNFVPDHGRITAYRGAFGPGIRVDGGTAYSGAVVSPFYDSMIEKVTAWAPSSDEVVARMDRALREYRIRGIATNLEFLEAVVNHPKFRNSSYTTRFVDETPELYKAKTGRDRATRLLSYIADVSVNGHPQTRDRPRPVRFGSVLAPVISDREQSVETTRDILDRSGPAGLAHWMRDQKRLLVSDTTMRDAHQSLLATRVRTFDLVAAAPAYEKGLPNLLSLECWGGATFDVAMRFLTEDPWERLAAIRAAAPNMVTQMLLRGANGVGYTNYPDNVVRHFIRQTAAAGMDIFRIFDCFNWVENMRVAIDAVLGEGKVAEGAICYTGDILDPNRSRYSLNYYVALARELERAGCQILALKDMAGLLKPGAARVLVKALREAVGMPVRLHTHDTSGVAAATLLAAVDAGVDAVDVAMDAMSGTTSQPCFGSIVEAVRNTERDTGLDPKAIRAISSYWDRVRGQYTAFESDLRGGASEVYLHEMPGGQFTNLREQARSIGLEGRWDEVARAYRDANDLLGDIVKVTPSSKVVGDLALMMVAQNLAAADVVDPDIDIAFPASLVEMLRGDLGNPPGGWPDGIQTKVLQDQPATTVRPGSLIDAVDLDKERATAERLCDRPVDDRELASYLMYPRIYAEYCSAERKYGPVSALPTNVFFYGMKPGDEVSIQIELGKILLVRFQALTATDEDGEVKVFFELNGQPRTIKVPDRTFAGERTSRRKADEDNECHVAAPMPGTISSVQVRSGDRVKAGDTLLTLEAMKMETALRAPRDGTVAEVVVKIADSVAARDLVIVLDG
ncbi:MAG: pyruvate carboxylase [Xanthobacteraceae bacterium]|nr:pyruvate carboxylase [Xanthobacteraceae bacterium]